jgi:hypothetical protein
VRAPERLPGTRIVAPPEALDAMTWPDDVVTLRLAADDLLVLHQAIVVAWSDTAALLEQESGFVGWWLTGDEVREQVLPHVEWPLPGGRPALAQGLVAGVPAKLWLSADRTLLLCAAAYAHELEERLR